MSVSNANRDADAGALGRAAAREIFRLGIDAAEFDEVFTREFAQAAVDEMNSIVLIELLVLNRDARFSVDHFLDEQPNLPSPHAQAAWSEVFLTPDGRSIFPTKWREVPTSSDLRLAFFVHFWDSKVPLQTTYGPIVCPPVEVMPERLERLMPYVSPD